MEKYIEISPIDSYLAMTEGFNETLKLRDLRSSRCERTIAIGGRIVKVGSRLAALGTERLDFELGDIGQGKGVAKFNDKLRK
jgi:hypothetical protein